jgi:hypothetical protein
MKKLILIILIFTAAVAGAQWPGAFYTFELKDSDGKIIDSLRTDYKFSIDEASSTGPAGIEICENNKLWRFYKGDKNLYVANFLIIEKISAGNVKEKMMIKFPPPITGGDHKYYANLYIGPIKFIPGTYKVRLPKTPGDWDALKEIELCSQMNSYNIYLDISKYQK